MTTTTATTGAEDRAAAATNDTGRAARRTTAAADGQRVLANLGGVCMGEGGAGAERMKGTSRGPGESPGSDPDHTPGPDRREERSTRRRRLTTQRRKSEGRSLPPGPGPYRGHTLVHALGLAPGPDTSLEDAEQPSPLLPFTPVKADGPALVIC